mmetsp:Transcript_20671/g.60073  ORF Transcript_20671/g.60073 Transcript_20671/m.60073 type:complete len:617 (-) Transcript_20671:93-1943(-)
MNFDADCDSSQLERCRTAHTNNKANDGASPTKDPGGHGDTSTENRSIQHQSVSVSLSESPTEFLLVLPGMAVSKGDPEYEEAVRKNAAFENRSRRMEHAGRFKERAAQTFHNSQRNAASIATPPETRDCGDGYSPCDLDETEPGLDYDESFVEAFTAALIAPSGCLLDVSDGVSPSSSAEKGSCDIVPAPETIQNVLDAWSKSKILDSPRLAQAARTMELAIQQTFNGSTQLQFLGLPMRTDLHSPRIEKLFAFSSASYEKPVTSMCWHKINTHILAVGYGTDRAECSTGAIMLWSLRNYDHPEMLITTDAGICALAYSASRPSLLAAGLLDGRIQLYDTGRSGDSTQLPVVESTFIQGRHQQAVHAITWMTNQRREKLISSSSDGRVIQWSYHKGLSLTPLMTLNRSGGTGSAISRVAAGLCMSFAHSMATQYVVGTGDGDLFQCSTTYSAAPGNIVQEAHTAPILQIKHSPFVEEAFLTASSDWSTKLWSSKSQDDCTLHIELCSVNLRSAVKDIAWSPTISTVFALVAEDGRVELWDIAESVLDPQQTIKPSVAEGSMNICAFSPDGSILLTGSSSGKVNVFASLPLQLTKGQGENKEAARLKQILCSRNPMR